MTGLQTMDDLEQEARLRADIRLHALVRAAFDGIIISENGVVIEVSRRLLDLSGYGLHQMIGRPVTDFVAPEFRDAVRERQAAATEGRFEVVGLLRDGQHVPMEVVSTNYDAGGRVVRVTALRDISEKRRLEQRARQAQKMETLGRLSSAVAHDFNNVLMVIRAYADTLMEDIPKAQRGDVQQIVAAVDSATALTGQLLAFARPAKASVDALDLNALVRSHEPMLRRVVGGRINLETDLELGAGELRIDPSNLLQVLLNLVINARDAMPGGGSVLIRTRHMILPDQGQAVKARLAPGAYLMLEVIDTGTGIPSEVQDRIFDPFFSTKENAGGSGLGLAIVKQIVDANGGDIVVESAVGAGTTFRVYFRSSLR